MNKTRLVFFGTPEVAVITLQAVAADYEVVAVVTEPDQPAGRGRKLTPPPVKLAAAKLQLPVLQPINKQELVEQLAKVPADLGVLVAYGKIIPESALNLWPLGIINIHASLLPKYRGAAPIQHTILNGEAKTGATLMKLDAGVDTGPVLNQVEVTISPDDTTPTLLKKVVTAGTDLLLKTLPDYVSGQLQPTSQVGEPTLAPKISKEMGEIDWQEHPPQILNKLRSLTPWPGIFTTWREQRLLIHRAHLEGDNLVPDVVQLAGRKQMKWSDFLNGYHLTSEEAISELKNS